MNKKCRRNGSAVCPQNPFSLLQELQVTPNGIIRHSKMCGKLVNRKLSSRRQEL